MRFENACRQLGLLLVMGAVFGCQPGSDLPEVPDDSGPQIPETRPCGAPRIEVLGPPAEPVAQGATVRFTCELDAESGCVPVECQPRWQRQGQAYVLMCLCGDIGPSGPEVPEGRPGG